MSGFDLNEQKKAASIEDEGTVVHIHGVDELPMFYDEGEGEERKPVIIKVAGSHSPR